MPNHKNIIDVVPTNKRFFNKRIQNSILQITHKQNSVQWCKFRPYSCPMKLLKISLLCLKTLFFNLRSAKRIKLFVKMVWFSRSSSTFRKASSCSFCRIFGYHPATSIVQKIKSSGKSRSLLSFFNKSFASFINDLTFCDNGFKWYSDKAEMFSVKNPLLEITVLPETLCSRLWILVTNKVLVLVCL